MPLTRIIDIENNLANILIKAWQGSYTSYTVRLLTALKAGNPDAARKLVAGLTATDPLEGVSKSINAYTNMAFRFGTQQITSTPTSKNDLHDSAVDLFKKSITENVVEQVQKSSLKIIDDFAKVQKAENSILQEFKSFAGKVSSTAERNLRMATQLHTSRLAGYGAMAEMNVLGITEYTVNAQLDKRVCPVCRVMHGRIFKVSDARPVLQKALKTKDVDTLKELMPWPSLKEATRMARMPSEDIIAEGWHLPPRHGNCRCLVIKLKDVPDLSMEAKPSSIESGANAKRYVPNPWDFVSTGLDNSPEVLEAWRKAFPISPMQLLAKLFGESPGLMTRDLLETRGFMATLNQRDLEFEVNNMIFGSQYPVGFKGSLSLETKSAIMDVLQFEEADAGIAKDVIDSAITGFQMAGATDVHVNANVGEGSFALARLGWCPRTPEEWAALKKTYLNRPWKAMKKDLPQMVQDTVDAILAATDPQAIWELADIGYQVNGKGLGQTLLEDTQWWGTLNLTDPHAMHRYNTLMKG